MPVRVECFGNWVRVDKMGTRKHEMGNKLEMVIIKNAGDK